MKHSLLAGLVGLVATFSLPALACPDAPRSAPGWRVDVFKSDDPGPRSVLFPAAPLDTMVVGVGPVRFGSLPNARQRSDLVQYLFHGSFRTCVTGLHEFQLIMEAAPNEFSRALMCVGELRQGQNVVFAIAEPRTMFMTEQGKFTTRTGSLNLSAGINQLRLRIGCGIQFYGFSTGTALKTPDVDLWQSGFALRVRAPGESQYRDFRVDEIFQGN